MKKDHKNIILPDEIAQTLIAVISDALLLKDGAGRWLHINEATQKLFQLHGITWQNLDWQNKTYQEIQSARPEIGVLYKLLLAGDEAVWDAGTSVTLEEHVADASGKLHEYEIRKTPMFKQTGQRDGLLLIFRDMTQLKQAERNLRIADAAFELQEAIMITDAANRIVRVNHNFTKLTGYSAEDVIGKTPAILQSGRHDQAFYQDMWSSLATHKCWQGEIWDRRKSGETYPKWATIAAITGADKQISNYVAVFNDLSKSHAAEQDIHRLAFYDPLTSLPNRRMLYEHLNMALEESNRNLNYGAILMADVDNFKCINDTKGHAAGDLLLIQVAQRLKLCVRDTDTVARLGGDEFVIILKFLSQDEHQAALHADAVSKKILQAINKPFYIAGHQLHSTMSIGISLFTVPTATSEEILKHADAAMYQAKAAGRNTSRFFDPAMLKLLEDRLSLESELRQALPKNQFQLYYQIQVNHQSRVLGAEVLLRWLHPQRGFISPDEFIPLAEETRAILPIGEWVLKTSCQQLKKWENNPLTQNLILAVNVSALQFAQDEFVELVCHALEYTGAKASLLKLELTESLILQNVSSAIEKMEQLKLLGVRFSMDDFGTGYSSLSYLKKLPINQLKIDRSFVQDIDTGANDAIIAQTIIGMGNNLGFNVIAEGVETQAQRDCLERIGCMAYQGYLYSKPVPVSDFENLLNKLQEKQALESDNRS
ncbi:MAG: EAL domain-containing protein [Methylophilaceae bacterium]